jgi:hypothetical protein
MMHSIFTTAIVLMLLDVLITESPDIGVLDADLFIDVVRLRDLEVVTSPCCTMIYRNAF